MTEVEQLELFVLRADELRTSKHLQSGYAPFLMAERVGGERAQTAIEEPDDTKFRAFLTTYRKFISKNELIYLGTACDLCKKRVTDQVGKKKLADAFSVWYDLDKNTTLKLIKKGIPVDASEAQKLWINGHYFHDDPAKIKRIQQLEADFGDAFRHHFLVHVHETTRLILTIASNISYAFSIGAIDVS